MMRDLRSWTYASFVLPRWEPHRHKGLYPRMRHYDKLSRCGEAELQAQSQARLNELFLHAFDTVPFYRDRLTAAGYRRGDYVDAEGLRQVPLLTRRDLLDHREELWSRSYTKEELLPTTSGGTTSVPVMFYRDAASQLEKTALQWHLNGISDFKPGDAAFFLWGAHFDYAANPSWRWQMFERHVMRTVYAQTSRMDDKIFAEHLARYNDLKPHVVYGYSNPIAEFCNYLERVNAKFHRPKTVICTAEMLAPEQRKYIESILGCKVFIHYGSRELGMTSSECGKQRMHYVPTATHFEMLPVADAEEGVCELICTDLINRGMPLIRYKINDCVMVDKGSCDCGLSYPLLGQIIGRAGDMVYMPDGRKVSSIAMSNLAIRVMKDSPGMTDVQFIQTELGGMTLRFVASPQFSNEYLVALEPKLREYCHPGLRWSFERVSEIPRERSGKMRTTICNLPRKQVEAETAR